MELKAIAVHSPQRRGEDKVSVINTIQSSSIAMSNSTVAHPVTSSFKIETLTSRLSLQAIEADWRKLEIDNSGKTTVFQSYDWAMAWCQAYLETDSKTELHVLTGKINGHVAFILPLAKTRKHGLTILDWLTDPIGQYGDILCAPNHNPQSWLEVAFQHLAKTKGIDLVRLRHVRANGNVHEFAKANLQDAKYNERAPFLDLTAYKTEADYDQRYTSTQRKRRKKIRKSLEDMGQVNFKTVNIGPEVDKLIEDSISEKNAWLSDRGRFNRIMGCVQHVNFLKNVSRSKSGTLNLLATELSAGGKPVSWEIGFRYQGTHFAYITSHVNALTDLSPGRLHMDLSQRLALVDGQKTFDLMVPYDVHKDSWSSGTIPTNDYFMPVTALGKIYGFAYLCNLRPLIRKIYYSLPPQALRLLQALTRR